MFDMAGTTVEDRGQVPEAFAATLAAHGVLVTPDEVSQVRGASKREAIRTFLPAAGDEDAERVYLAFRAELSRRYRAEGVRAIHGAADAFRALRGQGVKVALTTGFDRDITALLLTSLGWAEGVVDAVVCGDDVTNGRPAPDLIHAAMAKTGVTTPTSVANVGDTTLDLESAHRAGVGWNIGVLSGAHGRAALERAPHTALVASVAEVVAEVSKGVRA